MSERCPECGRSNVMLGDDGICMGCWIRWINPWDLDFAWDCKLDTIEDECEANNLDHEHQANTLPGASPRRLARDA